MDKSRVESITDGIIAIAATIMVLELGMPSSNDLAGLLELKQTFFAYVNSFFIIYIGWSMHHDLFNKADVISRKAFMVNGVWILILTLLPFTTAWVGSATDAFVPEFLYPLNMLLWNASFHWLDYIICKDNPDAERSKTANRSVRIFIYCGYTLCMGLAFIKPRYSIGLIIVSTVVLFIWIFLKKGRSE